MFLSDRSKSFTKHLSYRTLSLMVLGVLFLAGQSALMVQADDSEKKEQKEEASESSSQEKPAIQVGEETLSMKEFDKRVDQRVKRRKMRKKMQQRRGSSKGNKKKKKQSEPSVDREKIKNQVKEQAINRLILLHHANKSDVSVSDKEFKKQWDKIMKRYGPEKKLKKRLKKAGRSLEEAKKRVRKGLKIKKFVEKNSSGSEVKDEEVREFYDKNKKRMKGSFEKMKGMIRRRLEQKKRGEARDDLVEKLRKKTDVKTNL